MDIDKSICKESCNNRVYAKAKADKNKAPAKPKDVTKAKDKVVTEPKVKEQVKPKAQPSVKTNSTSYGKSKWTKPENSYSTRRSWRDRQQDRYSYQQPMYNQGYQQAIPMYQPVINYPYSVPFQNHDMAKPPPPVHSEPTVHPPSATPVVSYTQALPRVQPVNDRAGPVMQGAPFPWSNQNNQWTLGFAEEKL